jgi:O-antigen ligase
LLSASGAVDALLRKFDVTTLNGRMQIWEITLQAWKENPIFGYGAGVWGVDRQWQFHMFHVGHAHNQIVQTLGESGLAGLVLLAGYIVALLRAAMLTFADSRGLVLALLIIMLARFVTEAPMRSEGPLSWSMFLHVLVVVLACHFLRGRRALAAHSHGAADSASSGQTAGRLAAGWHAG